VPLDTLRERIMAVRKLRSEGSEAEVPAGDRERKKQASRAKDDIGRHQ
jgi:hypothetical protein